MDDTVLNTAQLNYLGNIIREVCRKKKTKRTHLKIRLIFMLARYAALRLKEIKELKKTDFLTERSIRIQGKNPRIVLLPFSVGKEIFHILEYPELSGIQKQLIDLDTGFIRRVLYQHGEACGFTPAQVNLRALREGRRQEMLLLGLPDYYVQYCLGYRDVSREEEKSILSVVEKFLAWEEVLSTSARNNFVGTVYSITKKDIMALVNLQTNSGLKVHSLITQQSIDKLAIKTGTVINALIKALHIRISSSPVKADNIFNGIPELITKGSEFAEVKLTLEDSTELYAVCPVDQLTEEVFSKQTMYFSFDPSDVILQPIRKFQKSVYEETGLKK